MLLGELIGINDTIIKYKNKIDSSIDWNDIKESGYYTVISGNGPNFGISFGVLLVLYTNSGYGIQIASSANPKDFIVKMRNTSGNDWSNWKTVSLT